MDRQHLAQWSVELSDSAFPLALAALGALTALQGRRLERVWDGSKWRIDELADFLGGVCAENEGLLEWRGPRPPGKGLAPKLLIRRASGRAVSVDCPSPQSLVTAWGALTDPLRKPKGKEAAAGPRLAIRADPTAAALAFAELLARSNIGAASVFLDADFPSNGRADWRWPLKIGALPEDWVGEPLATKLKGERRETYPFRFVAADRDNPRLEILVIAQSAAEALTRLLAQQLRLRCRLVIVFGLGVETLHDMEPLLRAIGARLSAEGVTAVDRGGVGRAFVETVDIFCKHLSHNQPIDVAIRLAFGPNALLLTNRNLLRASSLPRAAKRVSQTLRSLPPGVRVIVPEHVVSRLRLPPSTLSFGFPSESEYLSLPEGTGGRAGATSADAASALEQALPQFRFDLEIHEASAISELGGIVRRADRNALREKSVARFLQQRSFVQQGGKLVERCSHYEVGRTILLQIHIGPKGEGAIAAPTAFPDESLPPKADGNRLLIAFHEPRQFDAPMSKEILLPREGDSETAEFTFTPRETGEFEGRISVLHRGRVLQTVLLRTRVGAAGAQQIADDGVRLEDEVVVRRDWSNLGQRRQFDLAVILNHTAAGAATMTAVAGDRVWTDKLDELKPALLKINEAISLVAPSERDYCDGLDEGENPALLVKLARLGNEILSILQDDFETKLSNGLSIRSDAVEYLQVISAKPDTALPLEFIYDFEPPLEKSSVCPQHKEALSIGKCPKNCARAAKPSSYVCPMGFWGLKKVIERHMGALRQPGVDAVIESEPVEGRNKIEFADNMLIGHSVQVKPEQIAAFTQKLRASFAKNPAVAENWRSWIEGVKDGKPVLLVAFPHNEGKDIDILLEIGGDKLKTVDLSPDYIRCDGKPDPIVFLLGCDVAGTAQDFASHIRRFRQNGAAVVVSTVATVFGEHAVRVGEAIVSRLLDKNKQNCATIGEAIRDAKRRALIDSVPMALCVVAFGDADWRL